MKIAIIGYGKMGRLIESIAIQRNHNICQIIDEPNWAVNLLKDADVAIEFSQPESVLDNIRKSFSACVPIVVGTTGWYDHFNEVKQWCADFDGAILPATNFSLGVNVFFEINRQLAKIMDKQSNYQMSMQEIHHTEKLDSPSGTAITTAEIILDEINRYDSWKESSSISNDVISIEAKRIADVSGTHIVNYQSDVDQIKFIHEAKNRKGFAQGAVIAAEFLQGKKGVFSMKDVIKL